MVKVIDIAGEKFGRLYVAERAGSRSNGKAQWRCLCDCGNECLVEGAKLRSGHTQSCGCLHKERLVQSTTRHGNAKSQKRSPEYNSWIGMRRRCANKNDKKYKRYGSRGIRVCERWANSFDNFLADMGRKPSPNHSLDRIDNDGDYTPENCRWSDPKEQSNNRSSNTYIFYEGELLTLKQWSEKLSIPVSVISKGIRSGRFPP